MLCNCLQQQTVNYQNCHLETTLQTRVSAIYWLLQIRVTTMNHPVLHAWNKFKTTMTLATLSLMAQKVALKTKNNTDWNSWKIQREIRGMYTIVKRRCCIRGIDVKVVDKVINKQAGSDSTISHYFGRVPTEKHRYTQEEQKKWSETNLKISLPSNWRKLV